MKLTTSTNLNLYTFFFTIFTLLSLFVVQAAPTADVEKRDVFVPPILSPKQGDVWKSGQTREVTWDVSNPPAQITNGIGRIMLRKGNLSTPLILAANFDILKGKIKVKVPLVIDGDDYSLVLFGDSGNFSPPFTIDSGYPF
ncbi:hypothetical protein P691DRAFT_808542 [Macrolepiota fuliginosa MF-IS2]|uniref:Yeast cell wall synthesis Kre9/Knh1-like N-terminal domain-containing protein n=1 Tax=Macrolepiota fuliginosa MF-IS2 TaxID=1400762 RepID=A0A9P6CAR7_9AGAR|nr:hypothetical protein P691DRAFT_808542 [Macrolepiota fuliginosa MF-IS2]